MTTTPNALSPKLVELVRGPSQYFDGARGAELFWNCHAAIGTCGVDQTCEES